jgi:hypothetical protein
MVTSCSLPRRARAALIVPLLLTGTTVLPVAAAVAASAEAPVAGRYEWPQRPPWVGEIFELSLTWSVDSAAFRYLEGGLSWEAEPLLAGPWEKPTLRETTAAGGVRRSEITYRRRALALQPGSLTLDPAEQTFVLQTGTFRTSEYERAITESVPSRSAPATLEPRALPAAPAGFLGAVGRFTLQATAEPLEVEVGQAVTWTLTLAGEGNWPAVTGLPPRALSEAFEVVGTPEVVDAGAGVFERSRSEKVVVIPRRAGQHTLRSTEMVVFDPLAGDYLRIRSSALTLTVLPGAATPEAAAGTPVPDYMQEPAAAQRTLLADGDLATAPLSATAWRWARGLPLVGVVVLWLLLAWLRALRGDPERQARRAHALIGRALAAFAQADGDDARRRLLREWQREVALRWKLAVAAPVPAAFGEQVQWARLWSEAEVFLYGRPAALPGEWLERATRLWRALESPPRFDLRSVFRPANLKPLAWPLLFVLLGAPAAPLQAESAEGYWQQRVDAQPLDWRARHNLAVTLAERSRLEEAAAHAAVAWAQQPASAPVRELWSGLRRDAGFALASAGGLPESHGLRAQLAARAGPAAWQRGVIIAVVVAAGGAALFLLSGFGQLPRRARWLGIGLLLPGLLAALCAQSLLLSHGLLAGRDAVILWRSAPLRPLPVATFPEDEPVHLAGGTVARAAQQLLGWWRVELDDGRAGWLRHEDLLWVWQPPPPVPGAGG